MSDDRCLQQRYGNWSSAFIPTCQKPRGHDGPHEAQPAPSTPATGDRSRMTWR